jgi:hypothetical protein
MEHYGGMVDFPAVIDGTDGGEVFDAIGEANFMGRELKGLNVEVVVRFGKDFSI